MPNESGRYAAAVRRFRPPAAAWLATQFEAAGVAIAAPAREGLLGWLEARLLACAQTALDASRRAEGASSPELFAASLEDEAAWSAFLRPYPVIARLLESSAETWRRRVAGLAADLARDHAALGCARPAVEAVETHGELLQARRATVTVELPGGARWVHRTKELPSAAWVMDLCAALNRAGLSAPLHIRTILVRPGCSWDAFVDAAPCPPEEVGRYFVRAGMLVCLLERLGAADFHVENVLAAGSYPVLVDIETLFHPGP